MRTIASEERSNYPLTVAVDDLGERFRLRVKVEPQVGAARVWAQLHRALEELVAALETAPDRPLLSLDVLPEAEREEVVEKWNGRVVAYGEERCAHELFEAQVEWTPDAVAVVFEGEALSYGELNRRANRLAHYLRRMGVGAEGRVGLCFERSVEMVVALLGVLKAGGVYVPLDATYPAERLRYMVGDSGARVLLTQERLEEQLGSSGVRVLALERDAAEWGQEPERNPERAGLRAEHPVCVIYTSGSTGRPKGVVNVHGGLVNRLTWMQEVHGFGAGDVVLQNSAFGFDASVFEVFLPLLSGGRVVLVRAEGHRDSSYLVRRVEEERVSTAYFVCSMLQLFVEYEGVERCVDLRRLLCGGETLTSALSRRVEERLPGAELHNLYGPAESAVSVTGRARELSGTQASVAIGRPVANVRVYLLDGNGEPVPAGVVGELHVGGAQLARGYVGRPGLTAERFVADHVSGAVGERLYRTGDLGRWRRDGTIEFLGRNDFQVKVRGFRIEPGEIEARLLEQAEVREAVVVVREDVVGDQRLVAYWTGGAGVEPEALRAGLGEQLPEYMIPSAFVRLEALPRTPTGKLDRQALPAPEGEAYARGGYEPPADETEQVLAGIWAELLRVERVGRNDHFFALGGHSLLAVRVISRVRQMLEVEVPVRTLFERPLLATFAQEVVDAQLAQFNADELAYLTAQLTA